MPLDTDINLVDVDDAAQELGTAEADLYRLERLINFVSARIERYCQTRFKKRTLTLTLNGPDFDLLDVGSPIVSITSVTVGGEALATTDYSILSERGQLYRGAKWSAPENGKPAGIRNVVVAGSFGYDTIPYDVVEAAIILLRFRMNNSSMGGAGMRSERIGDYSYERAGPTPGVVDVGAHDLPEEVRALLDPFVRHPV
jgi:hypothetical protein